MEKHAGYLSPPRVMLLRVRLLISRPNAQASVGFVPGAKARSAHQSRGLASLVRVTWCFDCSPHGSAGSTGHAEAVVGFTCPKPAGRRCWVATAGDCTKFGVNRSKFPRTGGPLPNKLLRSWRAQPAPQRDHTKKTQKHICWGSIHVACKFGISGAYRLACRGGKRTTGAKHLHVHCTCTMHPSPFLLTAPSRPCQGVPMYRVWCP